MASFIERFAVPAVAVELADVIITPEEQQVLAGAPATFTAAELPDGFALSAYRRALINKIEPCVDDGGVGCLHLGGANLTDPRDSAQRYCVSDFYDRLDTFAICETDAYRTFTPQQQEALDRWYFQAYYDRLEADGLQCPTSDRVITDEQMAEIVAADERQMYLAPCDCKALSQGYNGCHKPMMTCMGYSAGPNSRADRGTATPISKGEALELVHETHRRGLIHTESAHGFCNCCGDCCYLFRAQEQRGSAGIWPATETIVSFDPLKCTHCGRCLTRCPFGVFRKKPDAPGSGSGSGDWSIVTDLERCVGCGLCVSTCQGTALKLVSRK